MSASWLSGYFRYFGLPGVEVAVGRGARRKATRAAVECNSSSPWSQVLLSSSSSSSISSAPSQHIDSRPSASIRSKATFLTDTETAATKKGDDETINLLPRLLSLRLYRRHHCRRCGLIFCQAHSSRTASLIVVTDLAEQGEGPTLSSVPSSMASSSSSSSSSSSPSSSASSPHSSIRARVCDGCYEMCRRVQTQYEHALFDPDMVMSPPTEATPSICPTMLTTTTTTTTTLASPTTEAHREFLSSRLRLHRELQREHRQALRWLCNDPTANRIVAVAAIARATLSTSARSPTVSSSSSSSSSIMTTMDPVPDNSTFATKSFHPPPFSTLLAHADPWEKIAAKRREQEIARTALSLEAAWEKQAALLEDFFRLEGACARYDEDIQAVTVGEKDEEEEEEEAEAERDCRGKLNSIVRQSKEKPFSRSYYARAREAAAAPSASAFSPFQHHNLTISQDERKPQGLLRIQQHNEQRARQQSGQEQAYA